MAPSKETELEAGPQSSKGPQANLPAWPSPSADLQLLHSLLPSSNSASPTHLAESRHRSRLCPRGGSQETSGSATTHTAARVSRNRVKVLHTHPGPSRAATTFSRRSPVLRPHSPRVPLRSYTLGEPQAEPAPSRCRRARTGEPSQQLPRSAVGSCAEDSNRVKEEGEGPGGVGSKGWGQAGREREEWSWGSFHQPGSVDHRAGTFHSRFL